MAVKAQASSPDSICRQHLNTEQHNTATKHRTGYARLIIINIQIIHININDVQGMKNSNRPNSYMQNFC